MGLIVKHQPLSYSQNPAIPDTVQGKKTQS